MRASIRSDRGGPSRFAFIWLALAVLLIISAIVNSDGLHVGALADLIYFGTLLAAIALGQHIVVVGGGIDLSVAAQLTLGSLVFAYLSQDSGLLSVAAFATLLVTAICGLTNGIAVTVLRITPLIATLGVASVVLGFAYGVPGAIGALQVPAVVNELAVGKPLFGVISRGTIATLLLVLFLGAAFHWSSTGRAFTLIGDNGQTALVRGYRVGVYKLGSYVVASLIYGAAAIWLAGLANTPGITLGNPYVLPSIAAVVIGGTTLGGGRGSVVATLGGALFLTQLKTLTLSLHAPIAVQFIVEGAMIALGMAVYNLDASRAARIYLNLFKRNGKNTNSLPNSN